MDRDRKMDRNENRDRDRATYDHNCIAIQGPMHLLLYLLLYFLYVAYLACPLSLLSSVFNTSHIHILYVLHLRLVLQR